MEDDVIVHAVLAMLVGEFRKLFPTTFRKLDVEPPARSCRDA